MWHPVSGCHHSRADGRKSATGTKKLRLLFKEIRVGLINGALLAVLTLVSLGIYIHFLKCTIGDRPSCCPAVSAFRSL